MNAAMPAIALDLTQRLDRLRAVTERQLFFVGGAPRSGTTWLQHLLDGHPDVSCRGEGLFWKHLALPLQAMVKDRGAAIAGKNKQLFAHTGGYPMPEDEDAETLLGTGILAAFDRQMRLRPDGGAGCLAVGEKTPENVFLFPRLKRLLPEARLIAIARDPRDVLASAWHAFIQRVHPDQDMSARKPEFIRTSLGAMDDGARTMVRIAAADPRSCLLLTYEALLRDTAGLLAAAFRFLGVSDDPEIITHCVERSSFERLSGGRARGVEQPDSFMRRGTAGGWRDTLDDEMNAVILERLGWMFPRFGWEP